MSVPSAPPPTYSQQLQEVGELPPENGFPDAQLLISPPDNSSTFQKGFLGVSDEHAAIEGEIQIKGVPVESWESVSIALKSYECALHYKVELNSVQIELFSRSQPSASTSCAITPSSMTFSVPLTPDTPQCLHMLSGSSSLTHSLVATLRTTNALQPIISRTVNVHVRRYSAHGTMHPVAPQTISLSSPTTVDIQVPRTTYSADEAIPVYVTIPPPSRSVVFEEQLVLRNVWAEVIRTMNVLGPSVDLPSNTSDSPQTEGYTTGESEVLGQDRCALHETPGVSVSEQLSLQDSAIQSSRESVIARSGSACRFHSTRPIRLRLLVHGVGAANAQYNQANSAAPDFASQHTADSDYNAAEDDDTNCASITQTTVLHSIQFRVQIRVAFLHVSTHTEQTHSVSIPITLLPPPAPLPEVDPSLDSAYRKKHDRPPVKTTRREDSEQYVGDDDLLPNGSASQAGPSAIAPVSIAPPPFDDAPPPFSFAQHIRSPPETPEASSSHLPTFLESEAEIIIPMEDHPAAANASISSLSPSSERPIEGEGILFGFTVAQQYDGYSYTNEPTSMVQDNDGGLYHNPTPPPTMEAAQDDPDVTDLTRLDIRDAERAIDTMNISFENREDMVNMAIGNLTLLPGEDSELPPPPPPLDDPSDPPPAIDIDFHSPPNNSGAEANAAPTARPSIESRSIQRASSNVISASDTSTPVRDDQHGPTSVLATNGIGEQSTGSTPPGSGQDSSLAPPPYLNPVAFQESDTHVDVEHVTGPPPYVDFVSNDSR